MISETQAEVARAMTVSKASTEIINFQVNSFEDSKTKKVYEEVESAAKKYDAPFDKAFPLMKDKFKEIANKYNIDSASLFCIYMNVKSSK